MSLIFEHTLDNENNVRFYNNEYVIELESQEYVIKPISYFREIVGIDPIKNSYYFLSDENYEIIRTKLGYLEYEQGTKSEIELKIYEILSKSTQIGASDIHFIRDHNEARIRLRIDGEVEEYETLEPSICDELLFVLYNVIAVTKETTWNVKIPQDANIVCHLRGKPYRFRYAHMPIFNEGGLIGNSYHAVLRVIYPNEGSVCSNIDMLGYTVDEIQTILRMLSNPSGMIVVSGTTGSGKSTTLKNFMEYLYFGKYRQQGCFISVEDPVEYVISGTQQSSVTKSKDQMNLFSDAVRSAMRRDPDILMIGEIRDNKTGQALASAVESGHLCLTTVHAANCVGVLQRLNGLGVPLDKLATPDFVSGIINQKLVPKLCKECAIKSVNESGRDVYVRNPNGCNACNHRGIKGRVLVAELLVPDLQLLKLTLEQKWVDIYLYIKENRSKENISEGYSLKEKIYYSTLSGDVCSELFTSTYGLLEQQDEYQIFSIYKSKKQSENI